MRLELFFNPSRIAIIGASERGMYPAGVLRNLLHYGLPGEIYPVNPRRKAVFGLPAYPDVTQTPHRPDLAIIIVPRRVVPGVLEQCAAIGVPAAIIITAGFAEADDEGRALQDTIQQIIAKHDMAVIGPNCAGLADIPHRVVATLLPAPLQPGPVSFLSQSGALMMALYGLFVDRRIGMNRLISLGNQVDVTFAEALQALAEDEGTRIISAFVEGFQRGDEFVQGLHRALLANKPVVLIKSGRTAKGQQIAFTHTAALAGSDRVFDGVCQQYGAIRVDDVEELMDTVALLAAFHGRLKPRGRVALVSQSGGLASLTADMAERYGLEAPPLNPELRRRIRSLPHILDFGALENPTDVRGAAVIGDATADTLRPFLEDPDTDAVVLLLAKSSVQEQNASTARAIVRAAQAHEKPLAVVWVGQKRVLEPVDHPLAVDILREAGIPLFHQPNDALRALARAVQYVRFRKNYLRHSAAHSRSHAPSPSLSVPRQLTYEDAAALLTAYGLPLAPARVVSDPHRAAVAAASIGLPAALKALTPDFTHKSDAGLVRLHLDSPEVVREAAQDLLARLGDARLEGLLVQQMIPQGVEVIAGVHQDPQFGPVVAFGPGGVLVELLDDMALRLPPLTREQALAMIQATKAWPLLQGFRGQSPADVDALADLLVNLARLAHEQAHRIHSLDLNPVIVRPAGQGAVIVDVRVFVR